MSSNVEIALEKAPKISMGDDWFEVIKLPKGVFALIENGHIQGVCSFLIIGSKKALLLDTGMGIGDISKIVRQLTDLETIVVNSHTHFDHIGDDWRFPLIQVYADDDAVSVLTKGLTHCDLRYDSDEELFTKEYPPGFNPNKYSIKAINTENIRLIRDGDIIDLGNRKLEVMHTPGHTQDSIMLIDRESRILLTGDTFCEWMFAFFDSRIPNYGLSNLEDYANIMKEIARLVPHLDYLYPSHGKPLADPMILIAAANAFDQIIHGDVNYHLEFMYGYNRRVYEFEGFSIWTS